MKVLTAAQMMEIDRRAIEELELPGRVLMENAGRSVAEAIAARVPELTPTHPLPLQGGGRGRGPVVVVVAGKGNNGGDALVAARHLQNRGADVRAFILAERGRLPPAPAANAAVIERVASHLEYLPDERSLERLSAALSGAEIVIDGLLGIGIKGAVRGYYAQAIELLNGAKAMVVAVDLPSGLEADSGHVEGPCVKADLTVTMALPKLGLLLYPGRDYVGELAIAEVGYPRVILDDYDSKLELIERELVAGKLPSRRPDSHKGTYGKVFVLAGSRGFTGAAALASEAALRAGAGLVTLGIPQGLNPILETKLTEVITHPLPDVDGALSHEALEEIVAFLREQDALALGPGLSRQPGTARLVKDLLPQLELPTVIDADGLNNLSDDPSALKRAGASLILTPHPGELSRLIKKSIKEIERDRVGVAREFAAEFNVILVLKGVPTVIARPDGFVYINSTGNSGLASGGSGDVLTGLIGGFLGQGLKPEEAAVCGVYLHGLIADRLREKEGERGMIAGDLLRGMPEVLREFEIGSRLQVRRFQVPEPGT